ncbi:MAG: hypothetical protein HYY22_08105 [Thaumarchaeota archaeon]|nr:hypothetical protein [Nitrososphaerota archaeon]
MLRKTKTANIVAAISVIAILISSSIFTIPIFAQNNDNEAQQDQQQQPGGVASPQGNQTATGQNASLTFHDEMRRMWLEHDIYMRLMLVTYTSDNMEDFNATVAKALNAQDELANFTAPYLGQTNTQNLSTALKNHILIYAQLLTAAKANDTATLNTTMTQWYDNAKEISTLLETALSRVPAGNQTVPGGNQTIPGGNQTVPGGNQTIPGDNQTKMAVIWILNGAGTNTSSLGYSPANATVILGINNTVTWINDDTLPHTVTSTVVPAGASAFDSGIIQPDQNYTYTFTVVGAYQYYCTLHPWMMGNVNVMGGNQTIPGGNQTIPGGNQTVPSGNQTVPGGNQSVPGGNQTVPGGNQSIPSGNQTQPGGNQTIPGGNQTIPGGNQTQMAVIWILNGAGTNMTALGYSPANATVRIGWNNTVTWINNDTNPHTVTSTVVPAGALAFDSGIIQPDQNYTYTFTVAGAYQYYCSLHPWMRGNVTVIGNQTVPGGNQTIPGGNQTIPGGNQTTGPRVNVSILQDMNTHLNLTMRMTMEYLNGNYTASLLTFQEIIKGTLKLADTISNAIITMFPSQFTQIGTVSRP